MKIDNAVLVLEGGAMRGVFTAGVLDYLMEQNIWITKTIGVSAGSCNAIDYASKQIGRSRDCMIVTKKEEQYLHPFRALKSQGMDMDMLFDKYPHDLHPFDFEAYKDSEITMELDITNCLNGQCEYVVLDHNDGEASLDYCKASCSMPIVCAPVMIHGIPYVDGGVADSIPLKHVMEKYPNCKPIVIKTQMPTYRKTPLSKIKARGIKRALKKYPLLAETIVKRPEAYNEQVEFINEMERRGKCYVMAPSMEPPTQMEKREDVLTDFYQHGVNLMKSELPLLLDYLGVGETK